jgi:hypothetical protein
VFSGFEVGVTTDYCEGSRHCLRYNGREWLAVVNRIGESTLWVSFYPVAANSGAGMKRSQP